MPDYVEKFSIAIQNTQFKISHLRSFKIKGVTVDSTDADKHTIDGATMDATDVDELEVEGKKFSEDLKNYKESNH